MRLVSMTVLPVQMPLREPLKMAGIVVSHAENVLVRLEDDQGRVGWGEAASAPTMTGETLPGMVAALDFIKSRVETAEIEEIDAFSRRLDSWIYGNNGAKSALDMALHDLAAQAAGVPLYAFLGARARRTAPILYMLGGPIDDERAQARRKADDGFVAFKVKVGAGTQERVPRDLARCADIRAELGRGIRVSADANQGYDRDEALAFARGAAEAGVDFFEQPVSAGDLDAMRATALEASIPIGADEGIHSLDDIERHHNAGAARGVSLKTIKLGGIGRTVEAGLRTAALGMHVNLACKTAETSVAAAAIAHLAVGLPQIDWDVSVTNQYLASDPCVEPISIIDGHIEPSDRPGLGVTVDEAALSRFVLRL
ncbi:mandelate racemase/muconate lactonizing enzyme family protein [Ancylobacter sonchi]|uniref:mandelate racemase/muconate lactonizing enzyme family protein n=1 Tax=Ancylobacter sonchi TaxID=1937790 RepID=UPI001BD6B4CC|nr:mandelate racemase/muconate lactonizing enzyme family protein [Ancylobacter sonchi]MBS7532485.1 mandelate racemase/muconate lactonizing enzyme family protein [Ancylobacter sonchi]